MDKNVNHMQEWPQHEQDTNYSTSLPRCTVKWIPENLVVEGDPAMI